MTTTNPTPTKRLTPTIASLPALPDGSHYNAGAFDRARRWHPSYDIYQTPHAFFVRSPSRAWPNSYLTHFYSSKFARLLAIHDPRAWARLAGVDYRTALYRAVLRESRAAKEAATATAVEAALAPA